MMMMMMIIIIIVMIFIFIKILVYDSKIGEELWIGFFWGDLNKVVLLLK